MERHDDDRPQGTHSFGLGLWEKKANQWSRIGGYFSGRVTGLINFTHLCRGVDNGGSLNPIAIVSFGSKIGPWLGRTASVNPGLLATLVSRLRVGGAVVGDKIADVATWVKSNPGNVVLIASTLATLGYSVADMFGSSDDQETKNFLAGLNAVAQKANSRINEIGASSEDAKTGSSSEYRQVQDEVAIEVLSWARGFFGGVSNAVQAHRMFQAFVEMPLSEVRHGFSVYKLR